MRVIRLSNACRKKHLHHYRATLPYCHRYPNEVIGYDVRYLLDGTKDQVRMDSRQTDTIPVVDGQLVLNTEETLGSRPRLPLFIDSDTHDLGAMPTGLVCINTRNKPNQTHSSRSFS